MWNTRPVFVSRARAESKRSTLPPGTERRLGYSSGPWGRREEYCLKLAVVAVGGDAGGWSNHADNQDVRLLPKNPIGFDGDDPAGGGHVRVCIVSDCEPAAACCVQRMLAYRVVGRVERVAPASAGEKKQGEISPQSGSLTEMPVGAPPLASFLRVCVLCCCGVYDRPALFGSRTSCIGPLGFVVLYTSAFP